MRLLMILLCLLPAMTQATTLRCKGTHADWSATVQGDSAWFQLRARAGAYDVMLTTPAQNDPDATAYTLIGAQDTAILIVYESRCNTHSLAAHVLTQERTTALLLTGCCERTEQ